MPVPSPVPVAATAVRPTWSDLPGPLRAAVEVRLGAPVVDATSQRSGFTPGFASRLRLSDGRRVFVKAASGEHPWLVEAYENEAVKLGLLPLAVPAPRLQTRFDLAADGVDWLVLVFDDVDGGPPERPWTEARAAAALVAVADLSRTLTPAPSGFAWLGLADDLESMQPPGPAVFDAPAWATHRVRLADLLGAAGTLLAGPTLVHGDLRDDNVLLGQDGRVWVCDWNFPVLGPIWADLVCLACSMVGDGLDGEALLTGTGLVGPGDDDGVDCLLACLLRYFAAAAEQPVVRTSPYLRAHQRWYAEVTTEWLLSRLTRG